MFAVLHIGLDEMYGDDPLDDNDAYVEVICTRAEAEAFCAAHPDKVEFDEFVADEDADEDGITLSELEAKL